LSSGGSLSWNTFLGGTASDHGSSIAVDGSGNVYLAGWSDTTWGSPARAYSSGHDAFTAGLDGNGSLTWNTFLGGTGSDYGHSIAVDRSGNVYVAGSSDATWGSPVNSYSGSTDAFVAKIATAPLPIQLASFTATLATVNTVHLAWTTVTETNNYGFYVQQRATGEQIFADLPNSFVPGHGTTLQPQQYSYIDATVTAGQWSYRLKQIDLDGTVHYTDPVSVEVLTDVKEGSRPTTFVLEQNYPNPFNPTTTIQYSLPMNAHVTLKVFNLLGQEVMTLVDGIQDAGVKSVTADASTLSSGVYLYKLAAGNHVGTRKFMLEK
jgi:hypothetical protein